MKRWKKTVACIMAILMIGTFSGGTAFADTASPAAVQDKYTIDGVTYYSIGDNTNFASETGQTAFLRKALTAPAREEKTTDLSGNEVIYKYPITDYWGRIGTSAMQSVTEAKADAKAYVELAEPAGTATTKDFTSDDGKKYRATKGELTSATSMSQADYLMVERAFSDVLNTYAENDSERQRLINQIRNSDYYAYKDETTEAPVFFQTFTTTSRNLAKYLFPTRMIGIVYSDFKITPLLPEENGDNYVITKDEDTGITDGATTASSVRNLTRETISAEQAVSKTTSASVSSEVNGSEEYGFEESITVGLEKEFAVVKASVEVGFTASQTVSKGWSEGKESSTEESQEYSVGLDLPPHTNVMMLQKNSSAERITEYNCPVAVSFRVRVIEYDFVNTGESKVLADFKTGRKALYSRAVVDAAETDTDNINWKEVLKDHWNQLSVKYASTYVPFGSTTASFTEKVSTVTSEVAGLEPVYPLDSISTADNIHEYQMSVGEYSFVSDIDLEGTDTKNAPYYGFDKGFGEWRIVDEDGNEISDESVASVTTTKTGASKLTANGPGTVYLKYFINEDCYDTADDQGNYRKNSQLSDSAMIEVNVSEEPFKGSIDVDGSFTGYLGDDFTTFTGEDGLTASVLDDTGKEVDRMITWEAKQLPSKGVEVDGNKIQFTKEGTFQVRAVSGNVNSDWVDVTGARKPVKVTFNYGEGYDPYVVDTYRNEVVTPQDHPDPCMKVDAWYSDAGQTQEADLTQPVWDTITYYAKTSPNHDLEAFEAKDATCEEKGNIAYSYCSKCNKYFQEKDGALVEIAEDKVFIDPLGHDWEFVDFTWTGDETNGYTEAAANYKCKRDESHTTAVDAVITEVVTDPTCEEAGKTTYTAAVSEEASPDRIVHEESKDAKATEATGHNWDSGVVTKPASTTSTGEITYTCKDCGAVKKETTAMVPKATVFAKMAAKGKKAEVITWKKVKDADGYLVYFSKCDTNDTYGTCKLVKTITNNNTFKYTKKGLKKGKFYKAYVAAYKNVDGKKVIMGKSLLMHSVTGNKNAKYTNPKKVKVKKTAITVKAGKTAKIKGQKIKKYKKSLKLLGHESKFRYVSTNTDIAKVSKKGVITGKSKGTCKVYVIAVNGVKKTITVKVK